MCSMTAAKHGKCVFPDCSINSPFSPSIHSDQNDQVLGNPVIHADATDRLELPSIKATDGI